jgi:hypothetical protein
VHELGSKQLDLGNVGWTVVVDARREKVVVLQQDSGERDVVETLAHDHVRGA